MKKRKIKWYNIIYLVFNVYAIWLTIVTLKHIDTLDRTDLAKFRLTVIALTMYAVMYFGSMLMRKLYEEINE